MLSSKHKRPYASWAPMQSTKENRKLSRSRGLARVLIYIFEVDSAGSSAQLLIANNQQENPILMREMEMLLSPSIGSSGSFRGGSNVNNSGHCCAQSHVPCCVQAFRGLCMDMELPRLCVGTAVLAKLLLTALACPSCLPELSKEPLSSSETIPPACDVWPLYCCSHLIKICTCTASCA